MINTSSNNNNISEPLLNSNYNYNNITYQNNMQLKIYRKPLVLTNVIYFTFEGKPF